MERICHNCKHTPRKEDLYCAKCGAKLPPHTVPYRVVVFVVECVLLVGILGGGISLMNHVTSPNQVLRRYYTGVIQENYPSAYGTLIENKADFLTTTDFANAMSVYPFSDLVIQDIRIEEKEGRKHLKGSVLLQNPENQIQYEEKVELVANGRVGLFWTKWNIKSNMVWEDYRIETPAETKLYLNNTLVTQEQAKIEATQTGIRYTIPQLFRGRYRMRIESKIYKEYEGVLNTREKDSFTLKQMELRKETKAYLEEQGRMDFEHLWQSIYANVPYEQTRFPQTDQEARKKYDQMSKNRIPHGYRNVECVAFADYLYKKEFAVENGVLKARITVDALRAFSGRYYYFAIIPTDKVDRDTCMVSFLYAYKKESGKWELETFFYE